MRFFILGCNGMAGHLISLYLVEQGYTVFGFDRHQSALIPSIAGDARDTEGLRKILQKEPIDVIINCIGVLNQFAEADKALAVFLNAYLPHFLANEAERGGMRVIHMSTDCVFSGKRGGYAETDLRDGETFYDRSKALGELEDDRNLTLRNSIVGPDINPKGIGLLNWFMQQSGPLKGYTKAMWTGQTTLQLAKTMEAAAKAGATGLINAVPDYSISKYDLLQLFNRNLRNETIDIAPVEGINADKSLRRTNFSFDYVIPSYEVMVAEMTEWMQAHKTLYPHYEL